jgi:hypothetical protein
MPALLAQLDRDVVASIEQGGNAWAVTPPLRARVGGRRCLPGDLAGVARVG